jgi:nicotinamide-nucleotide amidase
MNVELITTGSELLLGFTLNTHVNYIARQLARLGLRIERQTAIGDDRAAMRQVIAAALQRAPIVIITGGLGPTSDDVTREVVAELAGRKLLRDESVAESIRERFRKRNRTMPDSIYAQAMVPEGARVLPNHNGTAPGLALSHENVLIIMLPGPPRELHPMFEESVMPLLKKTVPAARALDCRVFHVAGLPESVVEEKVAPVLTGMSDVELGYCARPGEVEVRIITVHADRGDEAERRIRAALGHDMFGAGDVTMEQVVVEQLTAAGKTMATAESCTGGLIAHRITNISGSSVVFRQGWVTYSNEAKTDQLGVPVRVLDQDGAVSEPVARAMAEGARQRSGADVAVAVTGIAGPTGATAEKPVGLVYVAVASSEETVVQRHLLMFDRETFKWFASQTALDMVRRAIRK